MINILVVEDDAGTLEYCTEIIESLDSDVLVFPVKSGEEALDLLSDQAIDGAFIDIELPGINGFVLAERIRSIEKYHSIPIIFATATDNDFPDTYKKYHNYDFIAKPFNRDEYTRIAERFVVELKTIRNIALRDREKAIKIRHSNGISIVKVSNIVFAEAGSGKINVVTETGEYTDVTLTLKEFCKLVNDEKFVYCSKSCVVNVSKIGDLKKLTDKTWDIYFANKKIRKCELTYNKYKELFRPLNERLQNNKEQI